MPASRLLRDRTARWIGVVAAALLTGGVAAAKPYGPGTGSAAAHMASSAAMTCEARSPEHTVALLELFTSEGCSSCPPADRWLQGLKGQGLGLDKVVPLSLHVGYWDAIGWKDPYAQAREMADELVVHQRMHKKGQHRHLQVIPEGDSVQVDEIVFKPEI